MKKTGKMTALVLSMILALGMGTGLSEGELAEKEEPEKKVVEMEEKKAEKPEASEETEEAAQTEESEIPELSDDEEATEEEATEDAEATEEAEAAEETEATEEPEAAEDAEATEEAEAAEDEKPVLPKLRVICKPNRPVKLGETIRLIAEVSRGEGYALSYQWQRDLGDDEGFEDIDGEDGKELELTVTEELLSVKWRVQVSYRQKAHEDSAEGELISGILTEDADFDVNLDPDSEEETSVGEEETSVENEGDEAEETEVANEGEEETSVENEAEAEEATEVGEETEAEGEAEEEAAEAEETVVNLPDAPEIFLSWDARDEMQPGETVTITATLTNAEYYDFTYQWQCNTGSGFEDVPGATSSTYQFAASAELLSADWQVIVNYELKLTSMPEIEDAPAATEE